MTTNQETAAGLPAPGWVDGLGEWLTGRPTPEQAVWLAVVIVAVIAVTALPAAVAAGVRRVRCASWAREARWLIVLAPPVSEPRAAEAFWAVMLGTLRPWRRAWAGQPHLGFDYVVTDAGATIRIWIPGPVPHGQVERAVTAAWPGARTEPAPALPDPPPRARRARRHATDNDPAGKSAEVVAAGGVLRLGRPEQYPIRGDAPGDPVRALLTAPGSLQAGETVWVQILARPVPAGAASRRLTHPGGRAGGLVGGMAAAMSAAASEVLDLVTPGPVTRRRPRSGPTGRPVGGRGGRGRGGGERDGRQRRISSARDRAAAGKDYGGGYATTVRYLSTATLPDPRTDSAGAVGDGPRPAAQAGGAAADRRRVRAVVRGRVRGRAHAVAGVFAAFGGHNHYRRTHLRHPHHVMARRCLGRGDLLSVPELAAIARLPTDATVPALLVAGARAVAPPRGVPTPGRGVKPLGDADTPDGPGSDGSGSGGAGGWGGRGRAVGVHVADARHHLHVLGATGAGKSTLLVQMILADVRAHRGVLVIDPKGDLITDIHARLPADARDRLVLLDPDQPGPPPCLNPLAAPRPADGGRAGDLAVENLVSIFRRVFAAFWGPRTDDVFRAACLTLRAQPRLTSLADVPVLLTDPAVRARAQRAVTDPLLVGFWAWYDALTPPGQAQVIAPLMNKLRAVLLRPFAADTLTGPRTLHLPRILDGGIGLVRLPKGRLGDDTTRLIGSLVLADAWAATTARIARPPELRRDAAVVIDEAQNFLNLPYGVDEMLAEARGFRVSFTLAHQHLAQLPRELREAVSTNARNKIYFTVGPDDAATLARHTHPTLDAHDLAHLGAFHAAARLVVHGADTPAFTFTTRPLPPPP